MASTVFPPVGGGVLKTQEFTSTGTWVCPSNVYAVDVLVVSGGGGGGGSYAVDNVTTARTAVGGGGGGGAVVKKTLPVTPGTSYTITIGAGGAGGVGAANAAAGGTTSFGSLLSVSGGGAGVGVQNNANTRTNYDTNKNGATGGGACGPITTGNDLLAGAGGSSTETAHYIYTASYDPDTVITPGTGSIGSSGTPGFLSGSNKLIFINKNVEGFGTGAPGAVRMSYICTFNGSVDQVFTTTTNTSTNGNSAVANKGGGGGGSMSISSTTTPRQATGGSGGSGYMTISWTE